jgi:hypothetical protein
LKQIWAHIWPPLHLFSCPNRLLEERPTRESLLRKKKKKKQRESLLGKCFKETFQANLLAIIKQESMAHDPETSYNKIIMTPKSGI